MIKQILIIFILMSSIAYAMPLTVPVYNNITPIRLITNISNLSDAELIHIEPTNPVIASRIKQINLTINVSRPNITKNETKDNKTYTIVKNDTIANLTRHTNYSVSETAILNSVDKNKSADIVKPNKGIFEMISDSLSGFFGFFIKKSDFTPLPVTTTKAEGMYSNLSSWFKEVASGTEISIDPIGGVIYLYWLDENGNICHGTPGASGEGPMILYSEGWSELFSIEDSGRYVPEEELKQKQEQNFKFFGGSYDSVNNYDADGKHIVQFFNYFYRIREDGKIFMNDISRISLPQSIELEDSITPGIIYPTATAGQYDACYYHDENSLPIPDIPGTGSSSSNCQNKADISVDDIISACKYGRLQGSFAEGYFRII